MEQAQRGLALVTPFGSDFRNATWGFITVGEPTRGE
jgi:hypothetical protein